MDAPEPIPFNPPAVWCRHLLICRTFWFDAENFDNGYSLGRLVVNVHPPEGHVFPFLVPRLFAYVQLFGKTATTRRR